MQFTLFILLNATLFIRPAEIIPVLEGLPIYNVLILCCLAASYPKLINELNLDQLRRNPIGVYVLGILVAIAASLVTRSNLASLIYFTTEFFKIFIYFMLFLVCVNTPHRLSAFLSYMVLTVGVLTVVALLHYAHVVQIESIRDILESEVDENTSSQFAVKRLVSTGIFSDPNDLCLILLFGMMACLFRIAQPRTSPVRLMRESQLAPTDRSLPRLLWVGPLMLFGFALSLTHSRGGFLGLLAGVMTLLWARFGARKMVALGVVIVPIIFVLFAGRQTKLSASEDTGQDRIQLWSHGLDLFRGSPILGIGCGRYAEEAGLVAHNSYVNTFAELGFFGGMLFLGAFQTAFDSLRGLGKIEAYVPDDEMRRMRPYLLAILATYCTGMFSLSRAYVVPTYMILALCASYLRVIRSISPLDPPCLDGSIIGRSLVTGVAFLIGLYLFVRIFAQFSH